MNTLGKITQLDDKIKNAKITKNFITIPQTTINYQELHEKLTKDKNVKYLLTKLEHHKEEGLHIHIIISYKQQTRIGTLHTKIIETNGEINGTIDYQVPKELLATINYCKKEDTSVDDSPYLEYGVLPKEAHRPKTKQEYQDREEKQNNKLKEAIEKAEQGDIDTAVELVKDIKPLDYIKHKQQIIENLTSENKIRKYYTPPNMNTDNVKLSQSQQQVWDLLQQTPKQRRIIWVTGRPGSGKSFLMNYLTQNHEYQVYNAGQSASFDNVAYGYDREGVIAWDIPKSFDFDSMGDALGNVIEKFSDFGQHISSKKYNGKTTQVLGHTLVFSNHPPLEQLSHRDVIHINLKSQKQEDSISNQKLEEQTESQTISHIEEQTELQTISHIQEQNKLIESTELESLLETDIEQTIDILTEHYNKTIRYNTTNDKFQYISGINKKDDSPIFTSIEYSKINQLLLENIDRIN